jgi:hypothetical protein
MIDLSESFYIFLSSSIIGLLVGISHMIYKSKCTKFACCGMAIERDVAIEEKYDQSHPMVEEKSNV